MAKLIPCKSCKNEVSVSAKSCPQCGVANPGITSKDQMSGCLGIIILGVIIAFGLQFCSPGETSSSTSNKNSVENRQKGFHCLSSWDGSLSEFKNEVKASLKDPKSFEHIETSVTPVDQNGQHKVFMKYRAKNSFGGMVIGNANGAFSNTTCNHTITKIE